MRPARNAATIVECPNTSLLLSALICARRTCPATASLVARADVGLREGPDLAVEVNDGLAATRKRAAEGARYDGERSNSTPNSCREQQTDLKSTPKLV